MAKNISGQTNYQVNMPNVPYPIDDYDKLKQAIQLWCDRDDTEFVNQIPNFIDFAQKDMYRQLRIQPMAKEAYLPITEGKADFPMDWLQNKYMYFAANGVFFRECTQEEWSARINSDEMGDTEPDINYIMENEIQPVFCRVGTRMFFYPAISADVPEQDDSSTGDVPDNAVVMGYYSDPQRMTKSDDDPYMLEIAPDYFLYASCKHASIFCQMYDAADRAEKMANDLLAVIQKQDDHTYLNTSPKVALMGNIHSYWG